MEEMYRTRCTGDLGFPGPAGISLSLPGCIHQRGNSLQFLVKEFLESLLSRLRPPAPFWEVRVVDGGCCMFQPTNY